MLIPRGHWGRLRGIWQAPPGWGVLLRARSVHTVGMRRPITVVGIDRVGMVRWARTVPPGRVVMGRGVDWLAEMAGVVKGPPVGRVLRAVPILGQWPGP